MFVDRSEQVADNDPFRGYGAAVTPGPEGPRIFVTGYGTANRVLSWRGDELVDLACGVLADSKRHAIGVAAADLDEDGREEIYVHNADTFGGVCRNSDLLLDPDGERWIDLFACEVNHDRANLRAGRSVAMVDRLGTGRYGVVVTSYGAPMRFYELGDDGELSDMADAVGLDVVTGGRTLVTGPIVTDRMDIFAGNERGPNHLFRNEGGHYRDVADEYGVTDPEGDARGVALVDPDGDGRPTLACGNWEGQNRLFAPTGGAFRDVTPQDFADPTRVRNLVAADFDNDGRPELFVNVLGAENRLFVHGDGWHAVDSGAAREPSGMGTGLAVADVDADGTLELLVVHGEAAPQPLSLFSVPNDRDWLRVRPTTAHGAPARGALVTLETDADTQTRVVDAGSGYLCQMEPVAHFGLADATPERVTVRWPDGRERTLENPTPRRTLETAHPTA